MKYLIFITMAGLLLSFTAAAQNQVKEDEVPEVVKNNFKKLYPEVKSPAWHVENDTYEAVFKEGRNKFEASFNAMGVYLQTETILKKKALPGLVIAGLSSSQFDDWKIDEASFVETSENVTYYKLDLKNGKDEIELLFDTEGNSITNK